MAKDYLNDPNKIDVWISFQFKSSGIFAKNKFKEAELEIKQWQDGIAMARIHKIISKKLFEEFCQPLNLSSREEVHKRIHLSRFIVGYIKPYIATVNKYISDQKYLEGHILVNTISLMDIFTLAVIEKDSTPIKLGHVLWPTVLPGFPTSRLSSGNDAVFIRDLIDAMTAYFDYNLDDCIRKVVTSFENCIKYYNLQTRQGNFLVRPLRNTFRITKIKLVLKEYVKEPRYPYRERDIRVLRENFLFIYHLRNLIVHDKLRIDPSQTTVCRQALITLIYIYQGNFLNQSHLQYIRSFHDQFFLLCEEHSGFSLERVDHLNQNDEMGRSVFIKSVDDMNKHVFANLKITKNLKRTVKSGKHLPEIAPKRSNHSYRH
ncbi:MAG TPA: hypothetical protein VI483_02045 [Candidatus Paceibacterota bacterium]